MNSTTEIISAAITADVPVLLWGAPGTGKTATIEQLARDAGAECITLIGATLDPTDICGYPAPLNGQLIHYPPEWAMRIRAALDRGRQSWLYLDELSCAPPSVQAALLRVVQSRHVGAVDIRGCRIVAAANRADTAADGGLLAPATANRWAHIDWHLPVETWCAGELSGWGVRISPERALWAGRITAFIRRHPDNLLRVPDDDTSSEAWPSPRSWSHAIRVCAAARGDICMHISSCVGSGAGAAAAAYIDALDLPDPAEVLAGKTALPARGDQLYASLSAVVAYAASHTERDAMVTRAWRVLGSVRPDIALTPAKALLSACPNIACPEAVSLGRRILHIGKESK